MFTYSATAVLKPVLDVAPHSVLDSTVRCDPGIDTSTSAREELRAGIPPRRCQVMLPFLALPERVTKILVD